MFHSKIRLISRKHKVEVTKVLKLLRDENVQPPMHYNEISHDQVEESLQTDHEER